MANINNQPATDDVATAGGGDDGDLAVNSGGGVGEVVPESDATSGVAQLRSPPALELVGTPASRTVRTRMHAHYCTYMITCITRIWMEPRA
jgi:hypothetical protein